MAPSASKGGKAKGRDARSRNTTPLSAGSAEQAAAPTSRASPSIMSYEEILDRYCKVGSPPSSAILRKVLESLRQCADLAKAHSEMCDRGMREYSKKKRQLQEENRQQELAERQAEEERRERSKKTKHKRERDEERPLAVGAHQVARQDGGDSNDTAGARLSPLPKTEDLDVNMDDRPEGTHSESSSDDEQPPPVPRVPQFQTFGEDPSTFDDPTVYEIGIDDAGLSDEQRRDILCVAEFPHDDLHDLTCGTPPDRDFSNAKPPNQVAPQAFINYLESYVRPLAEEDLAFLRERGDRVTPFIIPPRGPVSYRQKWAEEDRLDHGSSHHDGNANAHNSSSASNQPSGSMDDMTDEAAEGSGISLGPMLARLLSMLRPERRAPPAEPASTNGDIAMPDADELTPNTSGNGDGSSAAARRLPAATKLPQPNGQHPKTQAKMSYTEMEERVRQELRHIGFVGEDSEPEYDAALDDEVSARLRYLQDELQRVSLVNGARKQRVLELAEEQMARQEYATIADDLDTQVNQGYLKRHRNMGKSKKNLKKPGGPGGGSHAVPAGAAGAAGGPAAGGAAGGVAKPALGGQLKNLLDRREQWMNVIGPVVEFGKQTVPDESIFDDQIMKTYLKREEERWTEETEMADGPGS